jgi:hypothetical protein
MLAHPMHPASAELPSLPSLLALDCYTRTAIFRRDVHHNSCSHIESLNVLG